MPEGGERRGEARREDKHRKRGTYKFHSPSLVRATKCSTPQAMLTTRWRCVRKLCRFRAGVHECVAKCTPKGSTSSKFPLSHVYSSPVCSSRNVLSFAQAIFLTMCRRRRCWLIVRSFGSCRTNERAMGRLRESSCAALTDCSVTDYSHPDPPTHTTAMIMAMMLTTV